ncbi:hypothetical protein ACH4F6_38200 [Streptomyces sp. NPDC017936]|uniref:hypothetical protein n=1 Tax=Streptomyces sp. NPDC017936 TaxID=3365016 RepID=UPI0037ABE737
MTKETPKLVNSYNVLVDYRAGGRDQTSTRFTLDAENRAEAKAAGRRMFDEWVAYNRARGYGDFTDLTVICVRCTFVDSRTA